MIEGLGPRKRYGYQIIKLPYGTWFWDPMFEYVEFVPTGKRASTYSQFIRHRKQNNLQGAILVALAAERDRIKQEEAQSHDLPGVQEQPPEP